MWWCSWTISVPVKGWHSYSSRSQPYRIRVVSDRISLAPGIRTKQTARDEVSELRWDYGFVSEVVLSTCTVGAAESQQGPRVVVGTFIIITGRRASEGLEQTRWRPGAGTQGRRLLRPGWHSRLVSPLQPGRARSVHPWTCSIHRQDGGYCRAPFHVCLTENGKAIRPAAIS